MTLEFDARVRLEFVGSKITSDAGLLAYRELDEKLGLTWMAGQFLTGQRSGRNIQHGLEVVSKSVPGTVFRPVLPRVGVRCGKTSSRHRVLKPPLVPLVRQSVYSRLAGYPDTNDADRLSRDPAMRLVVSKRASDRRAAARNTVGRFETGILATNDNQAGLVER